MLRSAAFRWPLERQGPGFYRMHRKRPDSETLIDRNITRQIIGAFFEVYNHLACGQFESVYRKALLHEMHLRGLTASEESTFEVRYKQVLVGLFRLDLLV